MKTSEMLEAYWRNEHEDGLDEDVRERLKADVVRCVRELEKQVEDLKLTPAAPQNMACDKRGLEDIVREVEQVFARQGVSGAVAVASENSQSFGIYHPRNSALSLQPNNMMALNHDGLKDQANRPFLASLQGLAEACSTISGSCAATWKMVMDRLQSMKKAGLL